MRPRFLDSKRALDALIGAHESGDAGRLYRAWAEATEALLGIQPIARFVPDESISTYVKTGERVGRVDRIDLWFSVSGKGQEFACGMPKT